MNFIGASVSVVFGRVLLPGIAISPPYKQSSLASGFSDHRRVALPYSSARTIWPTKFFPFGLNQTIV
jgi:hypothetical protein